jgi:hypothetical protein
VCHFVFTQRSEPRIVALPLLRAQLPCRLGTLRRTLTVIAIHVVVVADVWGFPTISAVKAAYSCICFAREQGERVSRGDG